MNIDLIVAQLKAERDRLDRAIAALSGDSKAQTGRRTLSTAARAKIAAAQRLRWKKQKAAKKS